MKNSNPSAQWTTSAGVEKRAENKKKGCRVGGANGWYKGSIKTEEGNLQMTGEEEEKRTERPAWF